MTHKTGEVFWECELSGGYRASVIVEANYEGELVLVRRDGTVCRSVPVRLEKSQQAYDRYEQVARSLQDQQEGVR